MRKKLLPIVCLALGTLSVVSCQKESAEAPVTSTNTVVQNVIFSPEVAPLTLGSRTAFDPDVNKVVIKDNETVAVGVIPSGQGAVAWEMATDGDGNKPIHLTLRASDQQLEAVIQHTGSTGSYDYFFVHPAPTSEAVLTGSGSVSEHLLPQEQMPSVDGVTFDPQGDILIGQLQTVTETAPVSSNMEITFTRLFVPFKVTLTDMDGLINGEAIQSVALEAPGADAPLSGAFSVQHSANAAEITYAMSATSSAVFRSVKASYATPLAENTDGSYNVWYVVNPTTLHGNITLTVTTPTRILTCSVAPGDPVIAQGKLNRVTVKMNSSNTVIKDVTTDLEAVYDAGGDFYIGNVKINKDLYPTKIAFADGAAMTENANGICFLAEGTYTLPKALKNLVIVGKEGADVTVKTYLLDTRKYTQIDGSLICSNVKLVAQNTEKYSLNNANSALGKFKAHFVLVNCRIEFFAPTATVGCSLSAFANPFQNIVLRNNKITLKSQGATELGQSTNLLGFTGAKVDGDQFGYVELVDNVIYSENLCKGNILLMDVLEADSEAMSNNLVLNFTHNTSINFMATGAPAVTIKSAKEFTFRNNLFWTKQTSSDPTTNGFRIGDGKATSYTGAIPTIVCRANGSFNIFTLTPSGDPIWTVTTMPVQDATDKLSVDPFVGGTFEPSTMTFIPAEGYKQYGARTW